MSVTAAIKTAFRVAVVTVLFTILGFALGGLVGILSVSIMRMAAIHANLLNALWFGGIPGGVLGRIAGATIITVSEKRARSPR